MIQTFTRAVHNIHDKLELVRSHLLTETYRFEFRYPIVGWLFCPAKVGKVAYFQSWLPHRVSSIKSFAHQSFFCGKTFTIFPNLKHTLLLQGSQTLKVKPFWCFLNKFSFHKNFRCLERLKLSGHIQFFKISNHNTY